MAASGGDDDLCAGGFGEAESGAVAGGDVALGVEQRAVQVDRDHARVHRFRVCDVANGEVRVLDWR
jgi:hypothetical protein